MKKSLLLLLISISFFSNSFSQAIYEDEKYVPETNPLVLEKLGEWQDLKFGLLMHWGAYSQWGIVESWSLCPEEYGWCERRKGSNPENYNAYREEYENLIKTFNPVKFHPEDWAEAAEYAGMKYVIFTTKHHDGFCMFDSKYTDYKVTGKDSPFAKNPRSNLTKEIFDAFRAQGLWAGAYFSKPDWHHPQYWDPYFPPRDRNVNYEPEAHPEKWQKYVDFTHNQILELLTDYGKVDILWLDGGWVAKDNKETITSWYDRQLAATENGYIKHRMVNQDIKMDELVEKAREIRPDLLVVDRAVHGINQNYLTPENRVPKSTLNYPWESCIISGGGWAHTKNAQYMRGREGIQLLVDIVAKGGNLLLNVAPTPEGEWQQGAYELLNEYGDWMQINGEAIYGTKPLFPYKSENICMTQKEDGAQYYFYMADEEETHIPEEVHLKINPPSKGATISLLGINKDLNWAEEGEGFKIVIPKKIRQQAPSKYVWVFKVENNDE